MQYFADPGDSVINADHPGTIGSELAVLRDLVQTLAGRADWARRFSFQGHTSRAVVVDFPFTIVVLSKEGQRRDTQCNCEVPGTGIVGDAE